MAQQVFWVTCSTWWQISVLVLIPKFTRLYWLCSSQQIFMVPNSDITMMIMSQMWVLLHNILLLSLHLIERIWLQLVQTRRQQQAVTDSMCSRTWNLMCLMHPFIHWKKNCNQKIKYWFNYTQNGSQLRSLTLVAIYELLHLSFVDDAGQDQLSLLTLPHLLSSSSSIRLLQHDGQAWYSP